jgi:hypothetical protein
LSGTVAEGGLSSHGVAEFKPQNLQWVDGPGEEPEQDICHSALPLSADGAYIYANIIYQVRKALIAIDSVTDWFCSNHAALLLGY